MSIFQDLFLELEAGVGEQPGPHSQAALSCASIALFTTLFLHLQLFVVLVPRRQTGQESSMLSAKQIYSTGFNHCLSKEVESEIISGQKCRHCRTGWALAPCLNFH